MVELLLPEEASEIVKLNEIDEQKKFKQEIIEFNNKIREITNGVNSVRYCSANSKQKEFFEYLTSKGYQIRKEVDREYGDIYIVTF